MSDVFLIATWKVGMTQVIAEGETVPVTLLEVKNHDVFSLKTKEKDGYNAICFSAGNEVLARKVSKPMLKQFESKELTPREKIFEYRLGSEGFSIDEKSVSMEQFLDSIVGKEIDVKGVSTGKGFAGVMKRWNFRGLEATHGVSITHRSHGSTGQRQDPGKVFKGKKMAGRLGADNVTVQNLKVMFYDKELNLIGVKGAVPGTDKGLVFVQNAVKSANEGRIQTVNGLKVIYS